MHVQMHVQCLAGYLSDCVAGWSVRHPDFTIRVGVETLGLRRGGQTSATGDELGLRVLRDCIA